MKKSKKPQGGGKPKRAKRSDRSALPPPPTTAIVPVKKESQAMQIQSSIPTIEGTVRDMERVRRFISSCFNVELQKRLATLKPGQELDRKERERLEIDCGTIPGVDKPFLKQPGSEKFMFWLALRPRFTVREVELPNGHLEIISSVTMYSKKTGEEVFQGPDCSCSTMESNYRFRWMKRKVQPSPNDMIAQKEVDDLRDRGMGKWKKEQEWKNGQKVGNPRWVWYDRIENPNIADERNKVRQIGEKRALVKCIRNMGALSEIFTSDPSEWDIPEEETDTPEADMDYTDSGRAITINGKKPSEVQAATPPAQSPGGIPKSVVPQVPPTPKPESVKETPENTLFVHYHKQQQGVVYLWGNVGGIEAHIKNDCLGVKQEKSGFWTIPADQVATLKELCSYKGLYWKEVSALPPSAENAVGAGAATTITPSTGPSPSSVLPTPKPPSETAPAPAANKLNQALLIKSVRIVPPKDPKKSERMDVNYGGVIYSCFDKELFSFLSQGVGMEAHLILKTNDKKFTNIIGIKRIGTRMFDSDGRTPIIQMDEPRPKAGSLFAE